MSGLIRTKEHEVFDWLYQAQSYNECSKKLENFQDEDNPIPRITLQAFSVECSLKAYLLFFNSEFESTHNLEKLFGKLPVNIKNDISQKFNDLYELDFKYCISEIKNDFVASRYFFEEFKKSCTGKCFYTGYLDTIADFLINYPKENPHFPD